MAPEIIGGRALQAAWESEAEDSIYPWDDLTESEQAYWTDWMADALAALRDAGWELYRPDDCAEVECFPSGLAGERVNFDGQYLQVWDTHGGTFGTMPPSGTYRLVPVEGENP